MLAIPASDTPEAPSTRWERTLLLVVATARIVTLSETDCKILLCFGPSRRSFVPIAQSRGS